MRAQLLRVSGATIDRLLKPTKDAGRLKGLSATKPGPLLRNSITVRKAGDEHEQAPGFIEADMVVHSGPTLAGEFARTLTATDVFTGWTENVAVRNGAHKWVLEAMDEIVVRLPFPMVGLDTDYADNSWLATTKDKGSRINVGIIKKSALSQECRHRHCLDNGTEFLNKAVSGRAGGGRSRWSQYRLLLRRGGLPGGACRESRPVR